MSDREAVPTWLGAQVVFICTANRARSPFAAAVLRRHLGGSDVTVESLGAHAQTRGPALPAAVRAASAFGIDLSGHRASALVPGALRGSDLVVGFERFHVAEAVLTGGASSARTFLLTELAEVVAEAATSWARDDDLWARLELADARRKHADALPGTIADPAGRSDRRFLETFAEIERLVALVATRLFGPARPAAAP